VLTNLSQGFPEARQAKRPEKSWKALVNFIRNFDYGSHAPRQHTTEVIAMMEIVEKLAPRTVLEIGTAFGGTLFLFSRAADPSA